MRVFSPTHRRLIGYGFAVYDTSLAFVAPALALWLRNAPSLTIGEIQYGVGYILISAVFSLIAFVVFDVNRGIPEFLSVRDVLKIAQAVFVGALVTAGILFVTTRLQSIPRSVPVIQALILGAGLFSVRLFTHVVRQKRQDAARAAGSAVVGESVILIGVNRLSALYMRLVDAIEQPRQSIVALLDESVTKVGRTVNGVRVYGSASELEHVIDELAIHGVETDRVLLTDKTLLSHDARLSVEDVCLQRGIEFGVVPELLGIDRLKPREKPGMARTIQETSDPATLPPLPHYSRYKRALSLIFVIPLIILLSPVMLLAALAAFFDVGAPVFFWQQRVGLNGRNFSIYKLRTLHGIYDRKGQRVPDEYRLSRTGRLIRKCRLDELPQLLNVLVGDMALIGPRPLLLQDQPSSMSRRLLMRPGITGWAQVNGGSLLTADEKGSLDDWYIAHASLWLDLHVVLLTLRSILRGDRRSKLLVANGGSPRLPTAPRVAFINRYFYPDHSATSQLLTDLAIHLAYQGHDVHVFTSRQRYDHPDAALPQSGFVDGVTIHRLRTTQFGRAGIVGRAFDYLSFYISARQAILAWSRTDDILVTKTDPPLLSILGMHIAKKRGVRIINWLQDIYPEIALELGVPMIRGIVGQCLLRWRDESLKVAEANVVVGDLMAERVASRGVSTDRIYTIPNWSDDDDIQPIPRSRNPLRDTWQLNGHFVVGYSGNLGRGHEFETILAAADLLRHEPSLLFLFISNSPKVLELHRAVHARGLQDQFRFLPPQNRDDLVYSLGAADTHLVSMKTELEGLMVPSKIYGIAAAGRPIISITSREGEVGNLVHQYDCGLVVEPGDAAGLAQGLITLMNNPEQVARMGRHARAMLDERFTRRTALAHWSGLFDEILWGTPRKSIAPVAKLASTPVGVAAKTVSEIYE